MLLQKRIGVFHHRPAKIPHSNAKNQPLISNKSFVRQAKRAIHHQKQFVHEKVRIIYLTSSSFVLPCWRLTKL